jgi:hypothetical protein
MVGNTIVIVLIINPFVYALTWHRSKRMINLDHNLPKLSFSFFSRNSNDYIYLIIEKVKSWEIGLQSRFFYV